MKKWLKIISVVLLVILLTPAVIFLHNLRDLHPDYVVDLHLKAPINAQNISVGFAKSPITPTIIDTWNDVNGDFQYKEEDGDTYNDINNNGKFDAFWIAGMSNKKPAQGVHDDIWSRVIVIDDGSSRIALVSMDAIGYMHDDVVDIREMIPEELGIDYMLLSSTHTHEGVDFVGIWGASIFESGVNPELLKYSKSQTVKAIVEAVKNMKPASLVFAEDLSGDDEKFIKDTRKPIVKATGIHLMQVVDSENGTTLGTIINWSNHPETLWNSNLLISSDFPHYIREAVENGIYNEENELVQEGLGGMAIYFSGVIGGLMTPHPSLGIPDMHTDSIIFDPTFKKAKAIGDQIAKISIDALKNSGESVSKSTISVRAKTLIVPLENTDFRLAAGFGLIKRGLPKFWAMRTEVGAIRIGPAMFLSIPGEIYPETVFGGIEAPEGRDFNIQPMEIPPLQEVIKDSYKFYIGLSNDAIGYIVPKSEWDVEKPYLYNDPD